MIKLAISIFLLIGIGFILYSLKLPYYTNQALREKLESDAMNQIMGHSNDHKKITENYYNQVEKLTTNKTTYFDLGSGIETASFCLIIFLFTQKINSGSDFKTLKSLKRSQILFISPIVWLLMIPGTFWYYSLRGERGDYAMFSDSIAIPIIYSTITILIGLVILIPFLIFAT